MSARKPTMRGAVLDLETIVDEDAAAWSGSTRPSERPPLRRIICASVLRFAQDEAHGEFTDVDLRTFNADVHAEAEIIGFVDRAMPDPDDKRSILITWNGRVHDLRLIRHRACALWMFALPRVRGWCAPRPTGTHVDMMVDANAGLGRGSWWALRDVCAGMSISLRPGDTRDTRDAHLAGRHGSVALRNRRDVVGTLLAYAYWDSFRRGCPVAAASAWTRIAALKDVDPPRDDGSASLTRHHLVEIAATHYQRCRDAGSVCGCAKRLSDTRTAGRSARAFG